MSGFITPDYLQQLSDFGVMIFVSAIVLIFLAKVLDFFLTQSKSLSSSILPKLTDILNVLSSMRSDIVGSITAHNTNANTNYTTILTKLDSIEKTIDKLRNETEISDKLYRDRIAKLEESSATHASIYDELIRREIVTVEELAAVVCKVKKTKK